MMHTNLIRAIINIVNNPVIKLKTYTKGSNRINNVGDSLEEYIKDKEDEMLEKTVAYVREFLGDPKNQDLLNHFDSEVRNAKYEGRTEGRALEKKQTAINMFKLGITKDLIMKSTGLNDEDLHELSIN